MNFQFWKKKKPTEPIQEPAKETGKTDTPKYQGVAPKEKWQEIEFVFTSGGVNYFKFRSDLNLSYQRFIAAKDIFTEDQWQINPDTLEAWVQSGIKLMQDPKKQNEKKVYEMGVLLARLKEMKEMSFSFVRTMKLATVLYFDEYEDPYSFDHGYAAKKQNHWMENNDVPGFFLSLPEIAYLPSLTELQENFPTYLKAETESLIRNLNHSITILLSEPESADLRNSLQSQVDRLKVMKDWSEGRFSSST